MGESQPKSDNVTTVTIRLKESWIDCITALALLDESPVIADQVRNALSSYLQQPPEADRRLQLRQVVPEDTSEKIRPVAVDITTQQLTRLNELAQEYSVTAADHIRASVNGYLIQRLGDAALPGQIELAQDRIPPQPPQVS